MLKAGDRVKVAGPRTPGNSDINRVGVIREILTETAVFRIVNKKKYFPPVARVFFDGGRVLRDGTEVCANVILTDLIPA